MPLFANLVVFHVQDAFELERDRRVAEGLEEELKRLHELDRVRRQRNGAADTNLAALRERVSKGMGGGADAHLFIVYLVQYRTSLVLCALVWHMATVEPCNGHFTVAVGSLFHSSRRR